MIFALDPSEFISGCSSAGCPKDRPFGSKRLKSVCSSRGSCRSGISGSGVCSCGVSQLYFRIKEEEVWVWVFFRFSVRHAIAEPLSDIFENLKMNWMKQLLRGLSFLLESTVIQPPSFSDLSKLNNLPPGSYISSGTSGLAHVSVTNNFRILGLFPAFCVGKPILLVIDLAWRRWVSRNLQTFKKPTGSQVPSSIISFLQFCFKFRNAVRTIVHHYSDLFSLLSCYNLLSYYANNRIMR